jgi:DNA-binding NtrC family response regulator
MGIDVRYSPKTVLYLGQGSTETKQVLTLLAKRPALRIIHVPSLGSLTWALRDLPANLIIVGPELSADRLLELFAKVDKLHPGVPVVALRPRADEDWAATLPAFTVVVHPFPAPVLLHLVDMALDASSPSQVVRAGSCMPN